MVLAYHLHSKERASKISGSSAALVYSVKNGMDIPEGGVWLSLTFSFHSLFLHEKTPARFWLILTTLILLETLVFSLFQRNSFS